MLKIKDIDKKGIFGRALLVVVTIIWGSSFVILKDTLSLFGGGNFTFFILAARFLCATLVLLPFAVKGFKDLDKRTVKDGVILGVILFFAYAFQTVGLKYTTASKNAFLTTTYCAIVPFLSWLILKKKPGINNYVAAVMCIAGVAFVSFIGKDEGNSNQLLGDILTIVCGLFYALQIIYNDKFAGGKNAFLILVVELAVVSLLMSATSLIFEFPTHSADFSLNGEVVWKILYLALFATAFAQFGQIFSQRFVPPTIVTIILSLESVFGVLFEIILGDAHLTVLIIIGFVMIFAAEIISELNFSGKKSNNA
ncbi:MAG: DMT family transporter [Clostridia bacterium]|nr:DMT family transporter [Clostridia bacterium]